MLAAVAGYCDASAFVALLGVFVSHMSGTSTRLAVELGGGAWVEALPFGIVVCGFFVGAVAGELWLASHPHALRSLLLAEAGVLLVVAVAGVTAATDGEITVDGLGRIFLGGLAATAMGSQASAVRKAAGLSVNTTFISGMVAQAAARLAAWIRRDATARQGLESFGGIWLSFVAGGVIGTLAVRAFGIGDLVLAAVVLAALSRCVWLYTPT